MAEELTQQNHPVTDRTVARLLKKAGYSLQANRKTREGSSHKDRNAQFEYINRQVLLFQKQNQPVISVDTKKKELVGEFKNPGQEWQPKDQPEKVKVHDFPDKRLGKAIPYGVYDLASNEGWVSVGIDHDTAQFAAASVRRWWTEMGSQRFPRASKLLITADGGGSNSSRNVGNGLKAHHFFGRSRDRPKPGGFGEAARARWMSSRSAVGWRAGIGHEGQTIHESASGRSITDSAPEAWPSEVRSFLGPRSSLSCVWSSSRASSAQAAAMSAQGV